MNVCYNGDYVAAEHAFDTTRKSARIAESLRTNPIPDVNIVDLDRAHTERALGWINTVHARMYVNAVRYGEPKELAESNGLDWDPGIWTSAVAHCAGMLQAATAAATQREHAGTLSSGFHHARRSSGDGFCTFNGLAIAALAAADAGKSVLILDFDAHCGGGTADILARHPLGGTVVHVDVAVDDFDGYRPAEDSYLDAIESAEQYPDAIIEALRFVERTHDVAPFDVCLYNAGMDPIDDGFVDGVDLYAREQSVAATMNRLGIPTAWTLAGGYSGDEISDDDIVALHRFTIEAFSPPHS